MDDLDFKKYIKYKLKYLELKQNKQSGGSSTTSPDPRLATWILSPKSLKKPVEKANATVAPSELTERELRSLRRQQKKA